MTDIRAVTRFFQASRTPPKLWIFCDPVHLLNFTLALVPGIENAAADYFSCLDLAPTDKVILKMTDSFSVHHFGIDLASRIPKQDEDEEDFHTNATPSSDSAATHQSNAEYAKAW